MEKAEGYVLIHLPSKFENFAMFNNDVEITHGISL
jgi:hypothetical protein